MKDEFPSNGGLKRLLENVSSRRILVIGDFIADEFVHGEIARVSREAPVLILRHEKTSTVPGGAGNAAANLAALGVNTACVGVVGRDRSGRSLTLSLRDFGVDTLGVVSVVGRTTPTKTRILAGSSHAPRQQVIRIDREPDGPPDAAIEEKLQKRLADLLPAADGVIVSDYGYGTVSTGMIEVIRAWKAATGKPVVVDSRYRLNVFHGFTAATPNQEEAEIAVGQSFTNEGEAVTGANALRERLNLDALLLTRGSEGMVLSRRDDSTLVVPVVGSRSPVDVTGAGDTVIATFIASLAAGGTLAQAMLLANHAAGLAVMKPGTATVSPEELAASLFHEG
jgi:D-glycero-beta-D-manno-heptose-7-phosphate kinase